MTVSSGSISSVSPKSSKVRVIAHLTVRCGPSLLISRTKSLANAMTSSMLVELDPTSLSSFLQQKTKNGTLMHVFLLALKKIKIKLFQKTGIKTYAAIN
jgi:glycine cleavage system regulatory protein